MSQPIDFVLLKPVDAQVLVSTARFQPWRATNVLTATAIVVYAFHLLGRAPSWSGLLMAGAMLCAAFFVVKIDNLTFRFNSIFDAARRPSSVFRGTLNVVFTFVVPLALMTTYPALALLGRLPGRTLAASLVGAAAFAGLARLAWVRAIGHYTSASS